MADSKVSQLTAATTPLVGTELTYVVQDGNSRRTTAQAIADLASTDLTYDAATRLLASSTGADVTLPVATASLPGLMAAADKALTDALIAAGVTAAGSIVTIPHIHGDLAGSVYIHVKNTSGGQLVKGTPVRVTGAVGDTTTLEVAAADATTVGTMPAIGILGDTLANNASGHAVVGGELTGLGTGSYSIGQALYVAVGGGLTGVKPTTGTVQQVAIVGRVHASTGSVTVTISTQLNPNWDTAYSERLRWDGGATGLDATTGRASLGLGSLATQSGTFSGTSSGTNTGDVTLAASVADVLSISGQELQADDPGADRLVFWDDSAGKLTHLTLGTNLTITGTTINAGGLTKFTEAESTSSPNATVYVDSLTAAATSTNADVALVPKGSGAVLAQIPDDAATGGSKRGIDATDWQRTRTTASQVASGIGATIIGGRYNTASGSMSVVGGNTNTASALNAVVVGGNSNSASSSYAFVGGGQANNAQSNSFATICGGSSNTASGQYAFVGGGQGNVASSNHSFIGGGQSNTAQTNTHATVCGGSSNTASGQYSFIGGGGGNTAIQQYACVVGGNSNTANGLFSFVAGGKWGTTRSINGYHTFPACNEPIATTLGCTQSGLLLLARETTSSTATVLTSNSSAAATNNQVILPNNSAYSFSGEVIAGRTGAGDTARWTINGAIKRGASAATTAMVGTPTVTMTHNDAGASGWIVAVTADTTNGGIKVEVTGAASTTIRWVCKINTTEMTF